MTKKEAPKWLMLGVIVLGTFMAILDTSIINTAIPKMMTVFNVSTDQIEWVLTAYMLAMGMVIPLTGILGEKFGLKAMYIFALITFTVGSAMCALSWGLSSMIVARIVQAVGGGMIMPISMTYIYRIIPRHKIGLAMGFWGIAVMAAPAIGPTLGGYMVETVNWQFIFAINIPIGIISVFLSVAFLKEFKSDTHVHVDYAGAILVCIGLLTLLLGLNKGNAEGWTSPIIVSLFFIAFISLSSFIFVQLNTEHPLLDLSVLKHYPFTLSLIISVITTFALFGGIFMIPIFLQTLQGYTAIQAGMLMFPPSIANSICWNLKTILKKGYSPTN
ncbi:MAG: DHA2 family efflux MFS transporter permease subunit [Candidatus Riflemargulisbacteria bacterium]